MNFSDKHIELLTSGFSSVDKSAEDLMNILLGKLTLLTRNLCGVALLNNTKTGELMVIARFGMSEISDNSFIEEAKRHSKSGSLGKDIHLKSPLLLSSKEIMNSGYEKPDDGVSQKYLMINSDTDYYFRGIFFFTDRSEIYTPEELTEYQFLADYAFGLYEMKRREEALKGSLDKAVESERMKNMIMLNISHEIRTPLNAIVGFSNLLSEGDLPEDSKKKYIDIILKSSEELLSIIADVTEISSLESNLQRKNVGDTNIDNLINEIIEKFSREAGRKGLTLKYSSELNAENAIVRTDRYKLEYIVRSLITNAFKFTYSGKVSLRSFLSGNMIHFTVSDTGRGIPEEYHDKIFDYLSPFENILAKKAEGPEIGIAISYTYVRHLGGEMWFNSKEGEGTVFSFTLPFIKTDHTIHDSELNRDESNTARIEKVILVAEDDDNNYSLIEHILRKENVKLLRAVNGRKAVDICKASDIDLVLMDIKMPEMDGYMATKLIKEVKPDQKIIAQTAYISDREYALSCGCIDFIAKPFGKQQLLSVVNNYI